MATARTSVDKARSRLSIWDLHHSPLFDWPQFKPKHSFETLPCCQLLALDTRHILALSHLTDPNSTCITGVSLQGYTRRGSALGSLKLDVPLRQVYLTPTPYRLLALEPGYPNSILFVDLKPLRVERVGLDIAPRLVMGTSWGYILVGTNGEIVLLNQYGQGMGKVDGPAHPTAIAPLSPYEFILATWDGNQGYLYTVDLQTLDLDVVF
jgi:serine/threonine-protein kinase